jgi:undecaprenyl-diphosphatase
LTPWNAFTLGIIQGLTEFLPVSSSGHLVLGRELLGLKPGGISFEIWLHLATLVAVVAALGSDIKRALAGILPGAEKETAAFGRQLAVGTIVGTIPAVVVGLLFKDMVESAFTSVRLVGVDLLITAGILFVSRFFAGGTSPLTPGRALAVGAAQALAILPGISRSGATLTAGLATGLSGVDAVRFSFILSIPAILGAVVLELPALASLGAASPAGLAVGFVTAAASGYVAIRIVWRVMERGRLIVFAPYCAVLGIVAVIWGGAM